MEIPEEILGAIRLERARQEWLRAEGKFVRTCADPAMPPCEKVTVLLEEVGEVARAVLEKDEASMRHELVQVAAVVVAWLEGAS